LSSEPIQAHAQRFRVHPGGLTHQPKIRIVTEEKLFRFALAAKRP
jgi:hypothetical protein